MSRAQYVGVTKGREILVNDLPLWQRIRRMLDGKRAAVINADASLFGAPPLPSFSFLGRVVED